jgi:serine/threonine-protein phosphatase 2B regulatory subunit
MCEQVFDLFDSKKDGMIDFGEFVKALSVFHPAAPQPQKAACKSSYLKRVCLS